MDQNYFRTDENIPEEIRDVFMRLWQDVASLFQMWDFYLRFLGNEEDAELLAKHLPGTLRILERSLRISLVMGICRLSDPAQDNKYENISLARLAKYEPKNKILVGLYTEFKQACKPFEIYRNKRFAHRDLPTTLDNKGNILPGINRKNIENVLRFSSEIINTFAQEFTNSDYQFPINTSGGPDQLLYWIKEGLRAKNYLT